MFLTDLRCVRIGPRGEPDVLALVGPGREDLVPVDDVLVAFADGARPERREVGPRFGLRVADREVDLALEDLREEELLLPSDPKRISVGPTVFKAITGSGTRARSASVKKISCSTGPRPCPPYSTGQPTPSQPSRPR